MIRKYIVLCCVVALQGSLLAANEPQETLLLWKDAAPGALGDADKDRPKIMVYLPSNVEANGAGIVVCPGGGYGGLAMGMKVERSLIG